MKILFAFGLGYSATALASNLAKQNWQIYGTSQTKLGATKISELGYRGFVFDDLAPSDIPTGAHWLVSIPPDQHGCPAARKMANHTVTASSITYLSTTGVYGDLGGGWAFEWTEVNPLRQRSVSRVIAENQWKKLRSNATLVRLPGIYGPSRSSVERVRQGTARRIDKPGQVFSRIHVDDLAIGLEAILRNTDTSGVLHLTDDYPAPQADVIAYTAELLGLEVPPLQTFDSTDLSPMAREFFTESKRVSNARAKSLLGWKPKFTSFREGIADINRLTAHGESTSEPM